MTQPVHPALQPPQGPIPPPPAPPAAPATAEGAGASAPPPEPLVGVAALAQIPPDQLTDAYKSGAWAPRANERVPVRLPDGSLGTVPATEAGTAVDNGAEIVPHDVVHHAELAEKYDNGGGQVGAGLAGAARGLSVGLSDPALIAGADLVGGKEAADAMRDRLSSYKEFHPWTSGLAEAGGVIVPSLFSGGAAAGVEGAGLAARGAGLAAEGIRGAGLATEGVSMLGRGAEQLAARVVGESAESAVGRAVQKAIGKGASGAVEGAVYGAGQEVSEDALGDHELTADKLRASMGHGAMLGGLVGGGMSIGGDIAKGASKAIVAKASPYLQAQAQEAATRALNATSKYERAIDKLVPGDATASRRALGDFLLKKVGLQAGDTVETIAPRLADAREAFGQKIEAFLGEANAAGYEGPKVEELARTLHSSIVPELEKLGLSNKSAISTVEDLVQDLRRFGGVGDVEEVAAGRMPKEPARPAVLPKPGEFKPPRPPKPLPEPTPEAIAAIREDLEKRGYTKGTALKARNQAYAEYRAQVTEQAAAHEEALGAARAQHDAAMAEYKASRATAMDWRAGEFAERLSAHEGRVADAVAARKAALAANEDARLSLPALHEFRTMVQDRINYETIPGAPANPKVDALKKARALLEDALVGAGEKAAEARGKEFAALYKPLKRDYQMAAVASNAAEHAATRAGSNARHSLTDKLFAGHGMAIGALTHGPLGALAGVAAGQASKLVRERGNATMAVWFDKLATLQSIARRSDQVDAKIAKGVRGFIDRAKDAPELEAAAGKAAPARKLTPGSPYRTHDDSREEYERRVSVLSRAGDVNHALPVAALAAHAPNVAGAFAQRSAGATAWLASQVPTPPKYGSKTPSDAEIYSFNQKWDAVDAPADVLAHGLADGTLTKTQVEAVKATAPSLYADVQKQIDANLQRALREDRTVPFEVRRDLALLFDVAIDWSMTPEGIGALQKSAQAQPDKDQKPSGPMAGPKKGGGGGAGAPMQSESERRMAASR